MVIKNLTIIDINSVLIQIQKQIEVLRQEIENIKESLNGE